MKDEPNIKRQNASQSVRRMVFTAWQWMAILLLSSTILFHSALPARAQSRNVGIGTTSPNASALLDLTSTSRGLLIPRMTEAQKYAIASPATGLVIYQTGTQDTGTYAGQSPTFWYYNGGRWIPFLSGGWLLLGNAGTSASTNFIGTIDSTDWVIRTHNTERVRVFAGGNVGLTNSTNSAEELRFYQPSGMGSYYSGFKAATMTGSVSYTWPPHDGNGVNYILCTDGAAHLSWRGFGQAGGGGLDTFWSRGTGRFSLIGHGYGNEASGDYSLTDGLNNQASGTASVVWGEYNQGSGYGSIVSGGQYDTASGSYATIGGGSNNSATANYSCVVAGSQNSACGPYAVVVGGSNNTACGNYAVVLGGTNNSVPGNYSLAFGVGCNVTQNNSVVYYSTSGVTVGIGNTAPAEALDITGNFKFSGAMMPNGLAGTPGNILQSGGGSADVWTSPGATGWSTWGNSGTAPTTNYAGTGDAQAFVFRTNGTERMRILSTGQVAIDTTATVHQLHSRYMGTTDETAAVFGQTTASTTNQAIGVWGAVSNTSTANTGTIGVFATGNGNTSAGQTNVALQLNDGEFTMGRTTEAPGAGTDVEGAAGGTAYSAQGPSGVIELTLGGGNLSTVAPTAGVFQDLGSITVNNRYCMAASIALVYIVSKLDDGVAPDCSQAEYFADVNNRVAGSFSVHVGMIPTITNGSNYSTSDKIRVGYIIVNPGR